MAAKHSSNQGVTDSRRYPLGNLVEQLLFGVVNAAFMGVMILFVLTIFWGEPVRHQGDAEWAGPARMEIRDGESIQRTSAAADGQFPARAGLYSRHETKRS